jgi:uncharacterized protein
MVQSFKDQAVIRRLVKEARTIAVVGLTDRPGRAGNYVPAYLQAHGYRIIPVNPNLNGALGEKAYPSLAQVPEPVDLVLIFRRPDEAAGVVREAIETGAPAVWLQSGIIHQAAAEEAHAAGLEVVMDACIMIEHRRLA